MMYHLMIIPMILIFSTFPTEIEDKVKRILKLIKEDNLEEDGTPVEHSKKEPLVELIEELPFSRLPLIFFLNSPVR